MRILFVIILPLLGNEVTSHSWHTPVTPYFTDDGWAEKKLIKSLLEDYDTRSRPVLDDVTPQKFINGDEWVQQITVEFGLELIQILDLNEMDQVLTTSVRTLYRWTDYHLTWNPLNFENITFVNIPPSLIWLPDVALYNYADERLEERRESLAKVFSDGTVLWHPMAIYKSTCAVHIRHFPMDTQACRLKFGPWSFDGYRVNITFYDNKKNLSMESYEASPEWHILGSSAVFTEIRYPCCPEPYPDISFYVWIMRRPAFYNYILILPCFLLSSLTLVLFWLPPETPAKMVLGMNIFVAFFLLLLLLEDTTPSASSSFPLLGTYYCLNMGIITLSSFLSCIIVNFHFRGDSRQEVPAWLKKVVIKYGSKILWVNVGNLRELLDDSKGLQLMTSDVRRMQATSLVSSQKKQLPSAFRKLEVQVPPKQVEQSTNSSTELRRVSSVKFGMGAAPSEEGPSNGNVNPLSPQQTERSINVGATLHPDTYNTIDSTHRDAPKLEELSQNSSWNGSDRKTLLPSSIDVTSVCSPSINFSDPPRCVDTGCYPYSQQSSRAPLLSSQSSTLLSPTSGQTMVSGRSAFSSTAHWQEKGPSSEHRPHTQIPMSQTIESSIVFLSSDEKLSVNDTAVDSGSTSGDPSENALREQQRLERLCADVNEIMKGLRYLQRIHENKERLHRIFVEWRAVGMVLDRFFFVCYFIIIILTIMFMFSRSDEEIKVGDHSTVRG